MRNDLLLCLCRQVNEGEFFGGHFSGRSDYDSVVERSNDGFVASSPRGHDLGWQRARYTGVSRCELRSMEERRRGGQKGNR